jgi:DNA-binding transcriptional MocR family regulator
MSAKSRALINLLRGWPNPQLLPAAAINTATNTVLSDPNLSTPALLYAPDAGYGLLREKIAEWLTTFYSPKQAIQAERICITGGASQNLANILQVFSDPVYTRNVWMITPTYFLACRIFVDSGFQGSLRAVPEDQEGIDLEFLSREIERSEDAARGKGNLEPVGAADGICHELGS